MAKNNHYKQTPESTPRKNKGIVKNYIITALCVLVVLATAGVIIFAIADSQEQISSTDETQAPVIYCSISYPDQQENGELWLTGGIEEYTSTTLKEALSNECTEKFVLTFGEDGNTIIALKNEVGTLTAEDGRYFQVYQTTTQGDHLVEDNLDEIQLEDTASYEIRYLDADGEMISIVNQ